MSHSISVESSTLTIVNRIAFFFRCFVSSSKTFFDRLLWIMSLHSLQWLNTKIFCFWSSKILIIGLFHELLRPPLNDIKTEKKKFSIFFFIRQNIKRNIHFKRAFDSPFDKSSFLSVAIPFLHWCMK